MLVIAFAVIVKVLKFNVPFAISIFFCCGDPLVPKHVILLAKVQVPPTPSKTSLGRFIPEEIVNDPLVAANRKYELPPLNVIFEDALSETSPKICK